MNLYAPEYYKDFACIKGECRHSCCLCWEIDVDDSAMEKYSRLTDPYLKKIKDSIESSDTSNHFRLDKDGRCPHLNKDGLCNIIINLSEDYLCDICRNHPRFYNVLENRVEVGVGMSCEAAARLILSSDSYLDVIEVGELDEQPSETNFDVLSLRNELFLILSDRSLKYFDRLNEISKIAGVSLSKKSDKSWRELISSLEYLDNSHREMFLSYTSKIEENEENSEYQERFLAYLIYRYLPAAESKEEAKAYVGFSLFLERLFNSLIKKSDSFESIVEFSRIISEEIEYSTDNVDEIKLAFYFE